MLPTGCKIGLSRCRNERVKRLLRCFFIWNASIIAAKNRIFPSPRQTDIFYRLTQFKDSLPQAKYAGGGRGCHFGALTRKTTIIEPSHFGHFQSPEVSPCKSSFISTPGSAPRHWKQSGRRAPRRRLARKPKFRMRTKPFGSRCNRKY
jgi:hypothetical protein